MRRLLALGTLLVTAPVAASAQTVLDFEGITTNQYDPIGSFYSGLGITFESNAVALCLNTLIVDCSNASRGGVGDPTSALYGMAWVSGATTTMNVAGGFTTGFSFFYSDIGVGSSYSLFSGLNGTGAFLGGGALPITPGNACDPAYNADYCPFGTAGTLFNGTALSVVFASNSGQGGFSVFDDLTLGSDIPGRQDVVPEPATMTLLATGLAGMAAARKKRRTA
ncbi:MAG: PEP-CTERM sorting domain-containing protein [Gemmatimonadales bacterium]|nr:PEP-CTERM sorting domain-containing protein [Gemmatimonadales bacterium]